MADQQQFAVQAKRLVVLRHFKQAVHICQEGLKCVRQSNSSRTGAFNQSALVVLAVQAYAEMGLWQEAVAFAVSTFGSTKELSLEVAQVCVSLCTNVQQFGLATDLVQDWLSNVDNCSQSRHRNMMEFYIRCVLPQQKDFPKAKEFIENNVLDEDEKKHLQDLVDTLEREESERELQQNDNMQNKTRSQDRIITASSGTSSGTSSAAVAVHHGFLIRISFILERLRSLGTQLGSGEKFTQFVRLLFLLFFLFAALTSSQGFLSKGSGVSVLYQAALQAWRALFAPYHMMSLKNL